jgi:hypothetical protein
MALKSTPSSSGVKKKSNQQDARARSVVALRKNLKRRKDQERNQAEKAGVKAAQRTE